MSDLRQQIAESIEAMDRSCAHDGVDYLWTTDSILALPEIRRALAIAAAAERWAAAWTIAGDPPCVEDDGVLQTDLYNAVRPRATAAVRA